MQFTRKQKITYGITAVVLATLMGAVFVELLYRSYIVLNYKKNKFEKIDGEVTYYGHSLVLYDENYGYTYNANKQIYSVAIRNDGTPSSCSIAHEINSLGNFEAEPTPKELSAPRKKILVFGDSFTSLAHNKETWVSLTAKKLKAQLGADIRFINFGRDGYGLLQMFDLAADKIAEFKPDMVIFAFITDDLNRRRFWRKIKQDGPTSMWYVAFDNADNETSPDSRIGQFMDSRVSKEACPAILAGQQSELLKELVDYFYRAKEMSVNKVPAPSFFAGYSFLWNRIRTGEALPGKKTKLTTDLSFSKDVRLIKDIEKIKSTGVPFVFLHLPILEEMQKGHWTPSTQQQSLLDELMNLTGQRDVLFLSKYMVMAQKDYDTFKITPTDGHPSATGINNYAEAMVKLFKDHQDIRKTLAIGL